MLTKSFGYSLCVSMVVLASTPITSSACSELFNDPVKDQAKYAVDRVLEIHGVSPSKIKGALPFDYARAVDNVAKYLEQLLNKATVLIFKSDLQDYIKSEINKKLSALGISSNRIPSSLIPEYNSRCTSILNDIKEKMWFSNTNYTNKNEIKTIIDTRMDPYFIQKIKSEINTATAWSAIDIIGDAWLNIFGNNNASASSSSTSSPSHTYFSAPYICSICNHEYQTDERVGVLSCGHCFHSSCAKNWLNNQKTCPLCLQSVFLAKIYDSKEKVPGYTSPIVPTYNPSAPSFEEIFNQPTPSAPSFEEVTGMPSHIYYEPSCSICLEQYKHNEDVCVLTCGHVFHHSCVGTWLITSKTCPLCRKENADVANIYTDIDQIPK